MAQPEPMKATVQVHVVIDLLPARRAVKAALRELDIANRELARVEEALQRAEFGIETTTEES